MSRGRRARRGRTYRPPSNPGADGTRRVFLLEPVDAWFFRDSRPFDAADPAQLSVSSLFPPMPQTAIGAVRAALALGNGWDGRSDWNGDAEITNLVGSGDDDLGVLTGAAVFLVRINADGLEPLFPVPHSLLGRAPVAQGAAWKVARLRPGKARCCDLGLVCLPEPMDKADDCGLLAGKYWLTPAGMRKFLAGDRPEGNEIIDPKNEICKHETRTGLEIDPTTRTAKKSMLYRVTYARPQPRVAIAVVLREGENRAQQATLPKAVPLGGEGRMAWTTLTFDTRVPAWPDKPVLRDLAVPARQRVVQYTATLATPADLRDKWPGPGGQLADLPGTIRTACMDRAVPVSGWQGSGDRTGPRSSRAMIPAGATWFIDATDAEHDKIVARHGQAIGKRQQWGYGRILIGKWN